MGVQPLPGRTERPTVPAGLLRRPYPLPLEIALLALVVLVWQLARIPLESSLADAVANSRRIVDAERAVRIAVEADAVRWLYARPDLLAAANWFYSHMDETLVFGVLAAMRLVDPLRYPVVRSAFALAHLPAILVVALFPAAPPRWVTGLPHGSPPAADFTGDLRNSTAAAVSLHVGIPLMLAVAAVWMRPRAPLAWAAALYPAVVFAVVLGTANHFVIDALVGAACGLAGFGAARYLHGPTPPSRGTARPATVAAAAVLVAAGAFAVNEAILLLT